MPSASFFVARSFLLLFLFLSAPFTVIAAQLTEDQEACQVALEAAANELSDKRNEESQRIDTSSETVNGNGNSTWGSGANQLAEMASKINEGNQKKAEVTRQTMEQERQINTEQFKQLTQIEDKEREINKQKSRLPIEINNAEFEKKKQEAEIRLKCQQKSEGEYKEFVAKNQALASMSQYVVNSISNAVGTRTRLLDERRRYYARCIADPATQEAFALARDELDSKLYNFNVESGILNADLEYTGSKIPRLLSHLNEQRRYVAEVADIQMNTIDQAQRYNQMAMNYALFTSALSSQNQQQAAATFTNADQVFQAFETIKKTCSNPVYQAYGVPADLFYIFSAVNRKCRPGSVENPSLSCVRSTGQPSRAPRPTATPATS